MRVEYQRVCVESQRIFVESKRMRVESQRMHVESKRMRVGSQRVCVGKQRVFVESQRNTFYIQILLNLSPPTCCLKKNRIASFETIRFYRSSPLNLFKNYIIEKTVMCFISPITGQKYRGVYS